MAGKTIGKPSTTAKGKVISTKPLPGVAKGGTTKMFGQQSVKAAKAK